ncbi:hypothetical protein V6N12_034430 [Hibiscus sabdariffa]|uniref:Uncharacterized protein n=1 Tax=Hibiscus sabdariffa TaxID=183260 RepID=A0ABR2DHK6_9ROSI
MHVFLPITKAHIEGGNTTSQKGVEAHAGKTKRVSSRDVVASLDRRVNRPKESMRDVRETLEANNANQGNVVDGAEVEVMRKHMEDLRVELVTPLLREVLHSGNL